MKTLFFNRVIVLWLFVVFSVKVFAVGPGKVGGSVSDAETGSGVSFATIELLGIDSTLFQTSVADSEGEYRFSEVGYGKYMLRISALGYRKAVVPEFEVTEKKPVVQFGTTGLVAEAKTLEEVTVIGHKLTGIMEEGKTVYTIKSKSAEFVQSGLELLRQLPDITVGFLNDEVKLAGSNNVVFQVNGRKVDQRYLAQLNPALVDKIEVITNPGAKYDSDVDAIINILLKKNMELGLSGRIRLQLPTSGEILLNKNNGNIDLYYKKARFYLSANSKFSRYRIETHNERISELSGEETGILSQSASNITKTLNGGFNYGFDWFPNDKNAFSFFSSVQPGIPNKNTVFVNNSYAHNLLETRSLSSNLINDKSAYYDYSLYYKHVFDKNHEVSVESYMNNRNNIHKTDYYEWAYSPDNKLSSEASNILNQNMENDNKQFVLKIDYTRSLSDKFKIYGGYNGYFVRSENNYSNLTSSYHDNTRYEENRQVAYTNLMWNNAGFNIQAGGRYEFSDIGLMHNFDTTNTYNYLLPSASVVYTLGKKHSFRLNYRRSVIRPNVSQLSPVNYSDNSYQQSVGNPQLKPGLVNRLEFTHRIQVSKPVYISYSPYVNFIRNDIRQVTLPVSDSVTLRQYANVGNDREYGLTISGTASVVKWLSVSPSFTYFKRRLQALPQYGIPEVSERSSWRLNISSQLILPKQWIIFAEYNYNASYINVQTKIYPYYECILGVNKPVNKQFALSVFTLNPWKSRYTTDRRVTTSGNAIQYGEEAIRYDYIFIIQLNYKFKTGREGKRLDRPIETDEGQNTKKGIL